MNLQRLSELMPENVIKTFEVYTVEAANVSLSPGSINIINLWNKTPNKIHCFMNSIMFNSVLNNNILDTDNKITLITDNFTIDTNNKIVFLKLKNKFFVLDSYDRAFDGEIENESQTTLNIQEINDFCLSRNIKIIFDEIDFDFYENIDIEIKEPFLMQTIKETNLDTNITKTVLIDKENYTPMIVNPVDVNEIDSTFYFATLDMFANFDIETLGIDFNDTFREIKGNDDTRDLIELFKNIYQNQQKILKNFSGMSEEEKRKFKEKIFGGTNPVDYSDYEINNFIGKNRLSESFIKTFALLCGGFIKSNFCLASGLNDWNKYYFPYYIRHKNGKLFLESEYFIFQNTGKALIKTKTTELNNIFKFRPPTIKNTLSEINISVDPKHFNFDNFKYLVYAPFSLKDKKDYTSLMYNSKENINYYDKNVWSRNIGYLKIFSNDEDKWRNTNTELLKSEFNSKHNNLDFFNFDFEYRKVKKYENVLSKKIDKYEYSEWEKLDSKTINTQKIRQLESPNISTFETSTSDEDYFIDTYYEFRVKAEYDKSAKAKNDISINISEIGKVLFNNSFLLTYDKWLEFMDLMPEKRILRERLMINNKLSIIGLFLPKNIYVNDKKIALPNIPNQTTISILFTE
ncbi:hypothetical protein [Mycoplasma tauri]|uniref:hypothetical protein n=1 Tax=Mycoplasma tauri TaxID=547987 RepID=UPI001CBCA1C9|nr:hypothetical protein [Mycoplasma tauri]MBZ4203400.1 hypothetical protein [Mycoplasma tauri]